MAVEEEAGPEGCDQPLERLEAVISRIVGAGIKHASDGGVGDQHVDGARRPLAAGSGDQAAHPAPLLAFGVQVGASPEAADSHAGDVTDFAVDVGGSGGPRLLDRDARLEHQPARCAPVAGQVWVVVARNEDQWPPR
jgi:hypothetical protein